ncbi:MAG: extracellular solute-binding protein [Lachnospiraceae bacterium]|nr:extracellular solute-binding protein [Lachnospiraceae bacterium]
MSRFKRATAAVLAGAMSVSLAACGSSTDGSASSGSAAASGSTTTAAAGAATTKSSGSSDGKTVINVWSNDRHDEEYVTKMVDQYNQTNTDNIEINLTIITDNYDNMIQMAVNGGSNAPDIIGSPSTALTNWADTGIIEPLNSYIDKDEEYQKVNDPYNHAYEGLNSEDGQIYYVYSGMRSGVRVEYNKDLLAQNGFTDIPKTLDEYTSMAQTITDNGNGEYYGIGFTSSSPFERLLEMVAQVSGIYYYDYVNGKFDFSGYKEIIEKGQQLVKAAYPDQQGVDNMRALFAQGSFALWSNASQEAGVFTQQLPITDFEWGVAEIPSLTGEIKGALQTTPSKGYGMIRTSKNKDAAWKVISYFQSEEFLKGYLEGGYCLPITDYMDGVIDKSKIGRLADFSKLSYEDVYPTVPSVNLQGDNYRTVLWNAVMGYVSADEAIADLNQRYNDALEADVKSGSVKRLVISDYDPLHPSKGTATYLTK